MLLMLGYLESFKVRYRGLNFRLSLSSEVESDLPEDIKERALSVFRASISDKCTIQQAIEKVQKEALCEVETRFKGQRFKVRNNYKVINI